MAFFNSSSMLVFTLLTTFLFINASCTTRFGVKATQVDLDKICSKTHNLTFCIQALKSDPRTPTADFRGLSAIAIDLTDTSVKETSELISTLKAKTTDVVLKQRYDECSKHYALAMAEIGAAKLDLEQGRLKKLGIHAMNAVAQLENCQDQFEVPPTDPSDLPQNNEEDVTLSTMVFLTVGFI